MAKQNKTQSNPSRESPMHEEPVRSTEPSRLECEICGKAFKTHTELDRHLENVHGNPEKTHTGPHTGHRVE
jgi:uncharacterized C2H2 Zn-finger protein